MYTRYIFYKFWKFIRTPIPPFRPVFLRHFLFRWEHWKEVCCHCYNTTADQPSPPPSLPLCSNRAVVTIHLYALTFWQCYAQPYNFQIKSCKNIRTHTCECGHDGKKAIWKTVRECAVCLVRSVKIYSYVCNVCMERWSRIEIRWKYRNTNKIGGEPMSRTLLPLYLRRTGHTNVFNEFWTCMHMYSIVHCIHTYVYWTMGIHITCGEVKGWFLNIISKSNVSNYLINHC